MKKSLIFIITLILLLGLALPCTAQTMTAPGSTGADVFAKYTGELAGCYSDQVNGGSASVTTDGGITITINGSLPNGLTLVVMPVPQSDTQAWEWFTKQMSGKAEQFMPFDIYFTDESGQPAAVNVAIEVTITVPEGYANPLAYSLLPDETLNKLDCAVKGKALTFTYSGKGYVVLAATSGTDTSEPIDSGKIPGTGDHNNPLLWVILCGVSMGGIALALKQRGKRYHIVMKSKTKNNKEPDA